MNFEIAMVIVVFSLVIGMMAVIVGKPFIELKTNKKLLLHICNILCVIGVIIYITFLFCVATGKHLNSAITYKEYPVEKVTLNSVFFNGRDGDSFNESYVILEEPNSKYKNVVVVETEKYEVQWLFCKVKISGNKYHVYLSDDIYDRFESGRVIYENKNSK